MIQAPAEKVLGKANSLPYRKPPRRAMDRQLDAKEVLLQKAQAIPPWLQTTSATRTKNT